MTRVVGCHIHHCPQCHASYAASAYASINLMEFRTWSDGYSSYALYAVPPRVLRCSTCGFVGLRERFTSNGTTPDRDESLPRLHDLAIAPTQLPTLIASHAWGADTDLALALYQQCWMEANHPYRERLLQHRRQAMRDDGFLPRVPVCDDALFEQNAAQHTLLADYAALHRQHRPHHWVRQMELHRQLGQFDVATTVYAHHALAVQEPTPLSHDTRLDADRIHALARHRIRAPALTDYG